MDCVRRCGSCVYVSAAVADGRVCFLDLQKLGKQVKMVRDIVREIAGVSPLERRGMELLKNGRDKRVLKLCKKRVSSLICLHTTHPHTISPEHTPLPHP